MLVALFITALAAFVVGQEVVNEKVRELTAENTHYLPEAFQPCNYGKGECVPYYLCDNGKVKTDGRDLIDIRFNAENECESYFETCCDVGDVETKPIPPSFTLPPPLSCGYRNTNGVAMRITGAENQESEFGEFPWMVAVLKSQEGSTNKLYACGGSLIHVYVVLTGE